jgi:hypothetical protein
VRVYLIGSKVTDPVIDGFLPAAARMGLDLAIVICALGPDPAAVERSVRAFRAAVPGDIAP